MAVEKYNWALPYFKIWYHISYFFFAISILLVLLGLIPIIQEINKKGFNIFEFDYSMFILTLGGLILVVLSKISAICIIGLDLLLGKIDRSLISTNHIEKKINGFDIAEKEKGKKPNPFQIRSR